MANNFHNVKHNLTILVPPAVILISAPIQLTKVEGGCGQEGNFKSRGSDIFTPALSNVEYYYNVHEKSLTQNTEINLVMVGQINTDQHFLATVVKQISNDNLRLMQFLSQFFILTIGSFLKSNAA